MRSLACRLISALLLIARVCDAAPDPERTVTLDRPAVVALRTGSGAPVRVGSILAWSHHTLIFVERAEPADEATTIAWRELDTAQAFEIRRTLFGRDDADQWLLLAILMLDMHDEPRAERAFRVALRLDPDAATIERAARRLHAEGRSAVDALLAADEATETPGAAPAEAPAPDAGAHHTGPDTSGAVRGVKPWPALTPEQHDEHAAELRARTRDMLEKAGFPVRPLETEHFLLLGDLAPSEAKRWAGTLDDIYRALLRVLDMPPDTRLFAGRCVIFIFNTRESFLKFEASAFAFDASRAGGVCHQRGGDVFVSFYRGRDPTRFQSVLIHETVHAFMYRYRSPGRLPTWADEGLADYVAGWLTPASQEPREHWEHCRAFVRDAKDPREIMAQSYADGSWYTRDSYPVSHMLVRFMLKYRPRQFKQWIDDIKSGVEWRVSMGERFGITPDELAEGFAAETRSEKYYTRLD